ncbi:MAG: DUF6178 family protein [Myxococcota bacterium]
MKAKGLEGAKGMELSRGGSRREVVRGSTSRQLLARLLDTPNLARRVAELSPAALTRVIDEVGLEDAGEIVALASTEQLVGVFDEDLWRNDAPGEEEEFDARRFGTWLSVLLEAGEGFAAERVSELSLDFVTLAFNKLMLVLNVDVMVEEFDGGGEEVDQVEKALSNCVYEEVDEFQLVAQQADGWDAMLTLVLALDRDHRGFLRRVLERCCDMSHAFIEENGGLYSVLNDEEMLENDARAEREDRRAAAGYVAATQAKSFLALAAAESGGAERDGGMESGGAERDGVRDAVTRAYFRELGDESRNVDKAQVHAARRVSRIEQLLTQAEGGERAAQRLAAVSARAVEGELMLVRALRALEADASEVVAARREELAYLANVLVAGASLAGRRFRPVEALEAALAVTNLGLELALEVSDRRSAEVNGDATTVLQKCSADLLFRLGFGCLQREVVLPARRAKLESALVDDVPQLADGSGRGLGFIATRAELARAKAQAAGKRATAKRGGDQRSGERG